MNFQKNRITKSIDSLALKKKEPNRSINVQFPEVMITKLEKMAQDEDVARNKILILALEHYWTCKKKS
jgi:hypothetical protein